MKVVVVKFFPEPQDALNVRLGGPQSRSRRFGEIKILIPLPKIEPPIVLPVA